jgi:hypothetical protein
VTDARENLHLPSLAGEVVEIRRRRSTPSFVLVAGALIGAAAAFLIFAALATRSLQP